MSYESSQPVFPTQSSDGIDMLTYLATHAPSQHIELTQAAASTLVGRPMPDWKQYMSEDKDAENAYQIAKMKFRADLDATLRVMWANSMIEALKKGGV